MSNIRTYNLDLHGLSEWFEIIELLLKSTNSHKDVFLKYIHNLLEKMKVLNNKYNIQLIPEEDARLRSLKEAAKPSVPKSSKSVKDTVFKDLALLGKVPNITNLDLSLPTFQTYPSTTVLLSPVRGMFFNDALGQLRFFRADQIQIADNIMLEGIFALIPNTTEGRPLFEEVRAELNKRSAL